ncbi:hypothetical protein [Actinopolymorpha pittospori]
MRGQSDLDTSSRRVALSRRAVLLAGLAFAGCGQVERPTIRTISHEESGDPEADALRTILDRRAKALRNADERAFLADLDERNERLIREQKRLFANLRQFEFTNFSYVLDRSTHHQEGGGHLFKPVIQITQLITDTGPGSVAPAETFQFKLTTQGGKRIVTDIRGLSVDSLGDVVLGSPMADAPWNFTALRVIRAGKAWLVGDSSVADLDRYAAAARTHLHEVEAIWGNRLRFPGYVLFFTRNIENFKKWYSIGAFSNFNAAVEGVEIPLQGVRRNGEVYAGQYAGSRIVVSLDGGTTPRDDPEIVMRHELAHAVTARATIVGGSYLSQQASAPQWAVEGFARWVETVDNPERLAFSRYVVRLAVETGNFSGRPPSSKDFYGEKGAFNYDLGASVYRFIARVRGQDTAVEFYTRVIAHAEEPDSPLTATPAFDEICWDVLGMRRSAFLQRWAEFVRRGD